MKLMRTILTLILVVHAGAVALAQAPQNTSGIRVTDPWSRAVGKMAHSAVTYMTLENTGDASDRLLSASAPVAGKVELHTHIADGTVMRMRAVQAIDVGPHAKVRLQPGGLHVMLIDLKGPLAAGSSFPLTLKFEKAGEITVDVAVKGAGAMGGEHGHGQGHGPGH